MVLISVKFSSSSSKAKEILSEHLSSVPFNEAGWRYILENHGGKLPVIIKGIAFKIKKRIGSEAKSAKQSFVSKI